MFVGVGASRVRDLFDQAKKSAPCIVFIDEIDAVGRQRGAGLGGGHDEREQTLNQLLVEMDGFDQNTGVILIAATNRSDVLDPALLRPGRFDRQIVVGRADFKGREKILEVHARNKPLGKEVSLETLAKRTPGFSGADLENLLNEAALLAARKNKNFIEMIDCDEAIDRVMVGPERKSLVMSQKEKEVTAFHESGHAIIGGLLEKADPVHKVTIIPRGMAMGITWSLPEDDRHSQTREELLAAITMAMGGRLAEEIRFGDVTTGASNDFEKATELARRMVTQYGMSELGPIQFGRGAHQVFLGRDFGEERNYSEEVASKIDAEVRKIIESCYDNGKQLLVGNWDKVQRMVGALLEYETVEAEEVRAILTGAPYDRARGTEKTPTSGAQAERPAAEEPKRAEKPSRIPPKISPEPA
jgi:cell division protease FtsH